MKVYILLIFLLFIGVCSAQSFSERHLTVTQTEYDLLKHSEISVSCGDFFCQEPSFTLTESLRPWLNDTFLELVGEGDYVRQCEFIQNRLRDKELIDWQYADFEKEANAFLKQDCNTYGQQLKDRIDNEISAMPVLKSEKSRLSVEAYPNDSIVNLSEYSKTKKSTTTTLKGEEEKDLKDKEKIKEVYTPNMLQWKGKIKLLDNKTFLNVGGYTNSYNIIVNFSSGQTTCNASMLDSENLIDNTCAIEINKNSTFNSGDINITGHLVNYQYRNVTSYWSIYTDAKAWNNISFLTFYDSYGNIYYCNTSINDTWSCKWIETGGTYPSIDIVNSTDVRIIHWRLGGLRYCRLLGDGKSCLEVEASSGIQSSALGIDSSGYNHLAYYNPGNGLLRYCNDTIGSWTCVTVDSNYDGMFNKLFVDSNDVIHIVYGTNHVKYINSSTGWVDNGVISDCGSNCYMSATMKDNIIHYIHNSLEDTYCNNSNGWICNSSINLGYSYRQMDIDVDSSNRVHTIGSTSLDIFRYCNNSNGWICNDIGDSNNYPVSFIKNETFHIISGMQYDYLKDYAITPSNPSNIFFDVLGDNIIEWNMTGVFNYTNSSLGNFTTALKNCTENSSLCSGDFCDCPIRIVSNTPGMVELGGLNITFNTPGISVNVSVTNAPLSAGDTPICGCDCWDYDGALQPDLIKNYTWYVNGTQISGNTTTLGDGNCTLNANITCGCSCYDSFDIGGWVNSSTVLVGDTTPPYNSSSLVISDLDPCSTESSIITVNVTDASSQINAVYLDTLLPGGNTNLTMACSSGTTVNCTYTYSGYSSTININRIWMQDASNNWGNTSIGMGISFHTCVSGGGGGGGGAAQSLFEVRPRSLSESGERPMPARIVGSYNETYHIFPKTPGVITLKFQFINTSVEFEGQSIDASSFFKTYPEDSVEAQQPSTDFQISCRIPEEYRYPPYGIFTATLVVGGSSTEQIRVTCESEEHAAAAGSLSLFLNQEIVGGITVGIFFTGLVIFAVWFAFARR